MKHDRDRLEDIGPGIRPGAEFAAGVFCLTLVLSALVVVAVILLRRCGA